MPVPEKTGRAPISAPVPPREPQQQQAGGACYWVPQGMTRTIREPGAEVAMTKPDVAATSTPIPRPAAADVIGVLLAGGLSRRMGGGDKSLRDLDGETMLAHVIARVGPQVGRLVLNANGDPLRFAAFALPIAPDPISGFVGPLAGVLAGMRWSQLHAPHAKWVLTVSTDAPFLPEALVERLAAAAAAERADIVLAGSGGQRHPVIGLWSVALADDLERALKDGVRKVLDWSDRHRHTCVMFEPVLMAGLPVDPFFNANDVAELETARAVLTQLKAAAASQASKPTQTQAQGIGGAPQSLSQG